MSENFKKIKIKRLRAAIIKGGVVAISFGAAVFGVLLLLSKTEVLGIKWVYCLLIGLGVALIAGALTFLLFRPTEKKLAKKLDTEYSLDEKVQTMLAYSEDKGDVVLLQRQDTDERLGNIRPRRSLKGIWQYALIGVLALSVFFVGVLYPTNSVAVNPPDGGTEEPPPGEQPETPYSYDLAQQSAMADLLNSVRSSALKEPLKGDMISAIEALDESLKTVDKQSVMLSTVLDAIAKIDAFTEDTNTFREICGELIKYETYISNAVLSAVSCYRLRNLSLLDYGNVVALAALNDNDIESVLKEPLEQSRASLKISQTEGLDAECAALATLVSLSLADSGVGEDAMYSAFKTFAAGISSTADKCNQGYGDVTLQNELDSSYSAFNLSLVSAVSEQSYNCIMDDFVRRKLADIFGISLEEIGDPIGDLVQNGTGGGGGNGGGGGSGGYGDGDVKYGSDELVYDPDTGERVKYGDVLEDKYLGMVYDRTLSGELPEDVVEYINAYFEILYNGIQESENQENS